MRFKTFSRQYANEVINKAFSLSHSHTPDFIAEAVDAERIDELLILFQRHPKFLELTCFEESGVTEDSLEGILLAVESARLDQAFAHDQVGVRKIRQR